MTADASAPKAKEKASGSSGWTGRRASGGGEGKKMKKKKSRRGFQRRLEANLDLLAKAWCDADDAGKRDWGGMGHLELTGARSFAIPGEERFGAITVGLQWIDALD